ncbi:MAG: hypothetical protein KGI11_08470 [Thaumarchaeota archaeon]|nr:hypothetical protein [Nitrososphaerota archaeon]
MTGRCKNICKVLERDRRIIMLGEKMAYLKEDQPENNFHAHGSKKWNRAEINKTLTWCADCGKLHTAIPVQGKVRCPFCNRWSKYHLFVRAYKIVFYPSKQTQSQK